MAHLFKRGKTWWISYSDNGKRIRKSLKTESKRVAERERIAIEGKLLEPHRHAPESKNPEIDTFWTQYLTWAADHLRPATISIQTHFWNQMTGYLKPARLGDVTRQGIEEFKRWRREKGNSEQTVNNALKDFQAIYQKAIKWGVFTGENPCIGVERYKLTRTMPEFHTEEELNAIRAAAIDHGIEWVVLLGGWAGFRKNEIANARWEWFDFDPDTPTIRIKAFEGFTIKDSEERVIPMSRQIYDALSPTRKTSGYVFKPDKPSAGHARYRYDPRKALLSSLKDAGLTTKTPFQRLRMTFGSIHVQRGKNIFTVSKWLGHSSVQVTERHYVGIQAYDPDIDSF